MYYTCERDNYTCTTKNTIVMDLNSIYFCKVVFFSKIMIYNDCIGIYLGQQKVC